MNNSEIPEFPPTAPQGALERIQPHATDVGGLSVKRVLPRRGRRLIGPWCFLDHLGPVRGGPVELHVGAHPHIGLQTFTWMMQGEMLHRDSLGTEQIIRPGQVNLMTAGSGIVHTEDTLPGQGALHAAQLWIALPREHADTAPRFDHLPDLPRWSQGAVGFTLLVGEYGSLTIPAPVFSPIVGIDLAAPAAGRLTLELRPDFEYGLLPLEGQVGIAGEVFSPNELVYLNPGHTALEIDHAANTRALLIGGPPAAEEVVIWWNFVGHSRGVIAEAQRAWEAGDPRFGRVPGEALRLQAPPLPWTNW